MRFLWILYLLFLYDSDLINGVCINYPDFPNGNTTVLKGNHVLFQCHKGYELQGRSIFTANADGVLRGIMPVCSKAGCKKPKQPPNGVLIIYDNLKAIVWCKKEYILVGYGVAYCNGTQWSNELGNCQKRNRTDYSCGFESADLCGWTTAEVTTHPWKRVSTMENFPSNSPSKKYLNLEKGYFMRVEPESGTRTTSELTSPIYPRSLSSESVCCFGFQYYIYGLNNYFDEPQLELHVKLVPRIENKVVVLSPRPRIWKLSNPQIGEWVQDAAIIQEMKYDFQVIFTAKNYGSKVWDMAIDNVTLLTGKDCWNLFRNLKEISTECIDQSIAHPEYTSTEY